MTGKVRVALCGCRGWSKRMTQPALEKLSDVFDVVACTSRPANPDPAREAAERFGATFCPSLDDVLTLDEVEAVIMVTPNTVHREQTEATLAAGKHVFVEKPIANTVADGVAMVRAAEKARRESGALLMVGHNTRQRRAAKQALEYAREGRIGRVIGAEMQYCHDGAKRLPADAWRQDPAQAPGLPLVQLGIHAIDVANMFFGVPRQVASFHRRAVLERNQDCTASIIAYDEPITVTLSSNYTVPLTIWFRILGTEGVIEARNFYRNFVCRRRGEDLEEIDFPEDFSTETELRHFAECCRGEREVETDGRAGVYALAVVEASIISAREKRFVDIEEIAGNL